MVMVTEEGVIDSTFRQKAVVRIQRSSACAHCQSRGACEVISDKEMIIEVPNDLQAKDGDVVEISIPTRSLLKLSLLVYFLPISSLVIGAGLGGEFAEVFRLRPAVASILGGGIAMAATFYLLKKLNSSAEKKFAYQPRMTRILISADSPQPADSI